MIKYCLTAMLLFSLKVWSQEIKPKSIGDKIPYINVNTIFNTPALPSNIAFNKGLIILDFMATNCISCLKVLPRFDSIQKIYGDKIKIFLVTPERQEKIKKFLQNHRSLTLPIIGEDTLLSKYFPHTFISHEVWIQDGVVKAITYPEYVNAENVATILSNKKVSWPVKNDNEIKAYSVIDLYLRSYDRVGFPIGHILLKVKDTSRYIFNGRGYKEDWKKKNTFSFDAKQLPDLDTFLGMQGRITTSSVHGFVLKADTSISLLSKDASQTLAKENGTKSISVKELTFRLNNSWYGVVVKNETSYTNECINVPYNSLSNFSLLQKEIAKHGLCLLPANIVAELLVISESSNSIFNK